MSAGFVKLWRSIEHNELLENDNTAFIVFIKLLYRVDRETGTYKTGRYKLAAICNMNPNTLYSALKRLEASTMIQLDSNRKSTTIHICNWWKYQQDVNKSSTKRQSTVNTEQEREKKENNKKEIYKEKNEFDRLNGLWSELSGRKMSDTKTARSSLKKLLKSHTAEEIEYAIKGAVYFQGKQYKPQVMSFASLYDKWDNLTGHMQAELRKGAEGENNRFE